MRVKYKINKRGKTIKPQQLLKIFTDCDTQKLLINFENGRSIRELFKNLEIKPIHNIKTKIK